jgi:hypothetical protein
MEEQVSKYLFIVDTEKYAGNFEREMTAYCTGQVGDCEVGEKEAREFCRCYPDLDERFHKIILQVPDKHGCHRPTQIWPTPGWWNDGLGNEYLDSEWGKQYTIDKYKESAKEHKLDNLDKKPSKYPAYKSVAMFFEKRPPVDLCLVMMQRAREYCKNHQDFGGIVAPIKLTGFRLVKEVLSYKKLSLPEENEK